MSNLVFVNKESIVKSIVEPLKINLKIVRAKYESWELFKKHHYLSADLNKSARIFVAYWENTPVACIAILPQPSGYFKNGWRVSRIVVLPDYQGLGIGIKLLEYVAKLVKGVDGESHLFIRTVHPSVVNYCLNNSEDWRETSHSRKTADKCKGFKNYKVDTRICYAFEYVGIGDFENSKFFYTSFAKKPLTKK